MANCGFWTAHRGQTELCTIPLSNLIWGTGRNSDGELGLGHSTSPVDTFTRMTDEDIQWQEIAAGSDFSVMITKDGRLFGCGNSYSDALGKIGVDNAYADVLDPTQLSTDEDWSFCSAGFLHSMFVKKDGTLWGSGSNAWGQLGLGPVSYVEDFTQIGTDTNWLSVHCGREFTIAVKTDNTIWSTGDNGSGQLGLGDFTYRELFTQTLCPTGQSWGGLSTGALHCSVVRADGTIWMWGSQAYGQLANGVVSGIGIDTPFQLGVDTDWDYPTCGENSTFGVKQDGTLYSSGQNSYGSLATGDTLDQTTFTLAFGGLPCNSLTSGSAHTLIIDTIGQLWVCGSNGVGQLGISPPDSSDHHPLAIGKTDCLMVEAGCYNADHSLILI